MAYGGKKVAKLFNNPNINGETAKYLTMMQNKIVQRMKIDKDEDIKIAKQMQDFLNVLKKQATNIEKQNVINIMENEAALN